MMEQVRLYAVWPTENWLGSSMNHIQGWKAVWECYCHALEKICLRDRDRAPSYPIIFEHRVHHWITLNAISVVSRNVTWPILLSVSWWYAGPVVKALYLFIAQLTYLVRRLSQHHANRSGNNGCVWCPRHASDWPRIWNAHGLQKWAWEQ